LPRGANATILAEIKRRLTRPTYLYQVTISGVTLRYAGARSDIIWGGYLWKAASITHSPIQQAKDTRIDELSVSFPFAASELKTYWKAGVSLNHLPVVIYKIFRNLEDPADRLPWFSGETDAPEFNEQTMGIRVRRTMGTFNKVIPGLQYMPICPLVFKSALCGYAGEETECDHTGARCDELGNTVNFYGCRWIPDVPVEEKQGHDAGWSDDSGGDSGDSGGGVWCPPGVDPPGTVPDIEGY
jgi:hypothetical protein